MSSAVQTHSMGGLSGPPSVNDCHHHNSGPVGGISDLDNIASHHNVSQVHYRASAMTPPPQMPSSPWTISDTNNHCLRLSEKLRVQREQQRFADLILSVQGREFPAHRCVLAACSTWFDSKLKVHKCTREHIEIDQCKDYEIFYALLTYCYSGQIVLNDANVPELLRLSNFFGMMKLKSYCCDYLGRHLSVKTVHSVLDQALKYQISDLTKQSMSFLQRHFAYLLHHQRPEFMNHSYNTIQLFLMEKAWSLPQELVLKFIVNWVTADVSNREEFLIQMLEVIDWSSMNPAFIAEHIDSESLYNSPTALYTILHVLERSNIYLGQKFQEIYQNLQAAQELDELNDSNSFLTLAINSAVKTLEHSEVDPDWFLQGEGHPLPAVVPEQMLTSSGTNIVMPQASTLSQRQERLERYKDSFDLDIFEQVINEQQPLPDERHKFVATTSMSTSAAKRYNPKFRALTEAIRLMEEEEEGDGDCDMPPPATSPKMGNTSNSNNINSINASNNGAQNYPPHPKQRHLSNSLAFTTASTINRSDMVSRNNGNLQVVYLQPPHNSSNRDHMGVRTDGSISTDYLQPSRGRTEGTISTDFLQTRVRSDGLSGDFRVPNDGLSSHYLPASQSQGHRNVSGMSNDYLPTTQTMVHDVPFEESTLMVDYDTLDSHDFIVPDVSSPSPAEEISEMNRHSKYYVSDRHYAGSGVSTPVLDSTGNELMQEQLIHQQPLNEESQQQGTEHQALHCRLEQEQQRLEQQGEQQLRSDEDQLHQQSVNVEDRVESQQQSVRIQAECLQQVVPGKGEKLQPQQVEFHSQQFELQRKHQQQHMEQNELQHQQQQQHFEQEQQVEQHKQQQANSLEDTSSSEVNTRSSEDIKRSSEDIKRSSESIKRPLEDIKREVEEPVYVVEGKKQKASKLQRLSSLKDANERQVSKSVDVALAATTQNRHVKKAKLLAEHGKSSENTWTGVKISLLDKPKIRARKPQLSCPLCSFTTRLKVRMSVHASHHEKTGTKPSSCPFCDFKCSWRIELRAHVTQVHGGPPYICPVCSHSSKKLFQLVLHSQIHSSTEQFSCKVATCDFTTNTMHRLKFHRKSKHRDEKYECLSCGKSFTTKQTLNTHQLLHQSENLKTFSCEDCDFSTKYANHLATHKKIHRGDVFRCSVDPCCSYTTPRMVHLRNHEKAHKGEKMFVCDVCKRGFVEKSQLTRHANIHSDVMPFACTRCKFKTKRKDKLKTHLSKIHKVNMSEIHTETS